jgi:hypothetical protein
MPSWGHLFAAALAWALSIATCLAQPDNMIRGSTENLAAAVPGRSGLTWREALKVLLPDAHPDAAGAIEATKIAKARRLDSDDEVAADGPFHITWLSARDVVEGGRPRLLVLAEVDQSLSGTPGSALLALIDMAPQPRLLDLVDVGDDRENYLDAGPAAKIGANSDLIMISSAHVNAGEEMLIRKALFVDNDHFVVIASVFLQSLKVCGYDRTQTVDFAVRANPEAEFGSLELAVTERAKRIPEDCNPQPRGKAGVTTWRATFAWNPNKRIFATKSRALAELAKHNEKGL